MTWWPDCSIPQCAACKREVAVPPAGIPDEVFEGAERLARRTKRSRSRLISDALREYLARHTPDEVTEAMNKAFAEIGEENDPFARAAVRCVLERSEW